MAEQDQSSRTTTRPSQRCAGRVLPRAVAGAVQLRRARSIGLTLLITLLIAKSSGCRESGSGESGPLVQLVTPEGFVVVVDTRTPDAVTGDLVNAEKQPAGQVSVVEKGPQRLALGFTALEADRTYHYRVRSAENVIAEGDVRTAPREHRDFRILAFGDGGTGERQQYDLARLMPPFKPDVIVHVGDLIYPDGEREDYARKFSRPYAELLKQVPFYAVIGNHDYRTDTGQPLLEHFVLPRNGPESETPERHFYFDYGSVRFVGLDTDVPGETLRDVVGPWLDRVLGEHTGKWKIVFFHHPMHTHAFYESSQRVRLAFEAAMERHGVDLVLQGHNHLYERSYPLRNDTVVPEGEGVVFVTTGAGGGELYPAKKDPNPRFVRQYDQKHSFTLIDVRAESMAIQQINIEGTVVDSFTLREFASSVAAEVH